MKIGCLGWGSLVWNLRALPVQKCWFCDGPLLPIEFARHSNEDRITLVLTPGAATVQSLWILMLVTDLSNAISSLANRENTSQENIGYWCLASTHQNESSEIIGNWASHIGLDAVVWTALPPKFNDQSGRIPTVDEVISFLQNLPQERQKNAEEYIRKTPRQIDTKYRRRIEAELNWTPIGEI
jgi:hypothetical protein